MAKQVSKPASKTAVKTSSKESKPVLDTKTVETVVETEKTVEKQLDEVLAAQGPVVVKAAEPVEPVKKVPKENYQVQKGSKMEAAIKIFLEMKDKPRKEIIERFVAEAGLTPAGSATYIAVLRTRLRKGQIG